MNISENLVSDWLPVIITILIFAGLTWITQAAFLNKVKHTGNENIFARQLAMLVLMLVGLISVVISLPISENLELQILSIIGLLISGLLAFSSTAIFGNLMAGAMMRFTQPFSTGDFIRVDSEFGRVTELGLFDCEIQTQTRELVSIPNSLLINKAVRVIRRSGTIISVELTLGYDLHHSRIDKLLLQAAKQTELEEPYVHITQLGDFSVSYKISGLLVEVKNLLTVKSNLHRNVLDCLHDNNIEILSPNYISQHAEAEPVIPRAPQSKKVESDSTAEDVVFDKAEQAQQIATDKAAMLQKIEQLTLRLKSAEKPEHKNIEAQISQLEHNLSELKDVVEDK